MTTDEERRKNNARLSREWSKRNPEKVKAMKARYYQRKKEKKLSARVEETPALVRGQRFSSVTRTNGNLRLIRQHDAKVFHILKGGNDVFTMWNIHADDDGQIGSLLAWKPTMESAFDAAASIGEGAPVPKKPKKDRRRKYEPGSEPWVELGIPRQTYYSLTDENRAQRMIDAAPKKSIGDQMTRMECLKIIKSGLLAHEILDGALGDVTSEFKRLDAELSALLERVTDKFPDAGYTLMFGRLKLVLGKRTGASRSLEDREHVSLVAVSGTTAIDDDDS